MRDISREAKALNLARDATAMFSKVCLNVLCIVLMWIVFKSISESRKDVLLKISAFCWHETKRFRLR